MIFSRGEKMILKRLALYLVAALAVSIVSHGAVGDNQTLQNLWSAGVAVLFSLPCAVVVYFWKWGA